MTRRTPVQPTIPTTYRPLEFVRPLLLLLLAERPSYGYELRERLASFGEHPDPGTVYRVLHSMEDAGLVRSAVRASEAGPDRRIYRVTAEGRRALDAAAAQVMALRTDVSRFLFRHAMMSGQAMHPRHEGFGPVSRALLRLVAS